MEVLRQGSQKNPSSHHRRVMPAFASGAPSAGLPETRQHTQIYKISGVLLFLLGLLKASSKVWPTRSSLNEVSFGTRPMSVSQRGGGCQTQFYLSFPKITPTPVGTVGYRGGLRAGPSHHSGNHRVQPGAGHDPQAITFPRTNACVLGATAAVSYSFKLGGCDAGTQFTPFLP